MSENLKKKSKGKFLETWLKDERYKSWICKVPYDDTLFHCIICNKNFSSGSSHVARHADSACHIKNSQQDIFSYSNDDDELLKIKPTRKKLFQPQWLEIEEFKPWLSNVEDDDTRSFCAICEKTISGGLSHIYRHAASQMHINKSAISGIVGEKSNTGECNMPSKESLLSFEQERKSAEIRFAALIADKDIPYKTAREILCLFKDIGKNSNVLKHMTIGKTKCKNIVSNILCPVETERVVSEMQNTKYSICLNEMSGSTDKKWLTLLVRYVDVDSLDVRTQLIKIIDLDATDCSIEEVFLAFKTELESLSIPFENMVALSCSAPVTTGKHLSLKEELEKSCKHVEILACPCYSAASIAQDACEKLPESCDELLEKLGVFITKSNNPKRCLGFQECFQQIIECFEQSDLKVFKLTETSWLSRQSCISRLLQHWDTIKHCLGGMLTSEKSASGEHLFSIMQNDSTKAYFLFLDYILNLFGTFSTYFQAEDTRVQMLQQKSFNLLADMCRNFLKPESFRLLPNVSFRSKESQRLPDNISLGEQCENYLSHLLEEGHAALVTTIRQNCLQVYVTAADKISKSLPIKNKFISKLKVFKARTSLFEDDRNKSFNDVSFIAETLGDFDQLGLKEEWFQITKDFTTRTKQKLARMNFDEMWKNILVQESTKSRKILRYPNLICLLNVVRSLPHSNADAENVFSYVTDLKHRERNKLTTASINAMCVVKSAFRNRKETAMSLKIDEKHLSLMTSDNLYGIPTKKAKSSLMLYSAENNNTDEPDNVNSSACEMQEYNV